MDIVFVRFLCLVFFFLKIFPPASLNPLGCERENNAEKVFDYGIDLAKKPGPLGWEFRLNCNTRKGLYDTRSMIMRAQLHPLA